MTDLHDRTAATPDIGRALAVARVHREALSLVREAAVGKDVNLPRWARGFTWRGRRSRIPLDEFAGVLYDLGCAITLMPVPAPADLSFAAARSAQGVTGRVNPRDLVMPDLTEQGKAALAGDFARAFGYVENAMRAADIEPKPRP